MNQLTVGYAIAGFWQKPTCQPCGPTPIHQNQILWRFKTILK